MRRSVTPGRTRKISLGPSSGCFLPDGRLVFPSLSPRASSYAVHDLTPRRGLRRGHLGRT